VSFCNENFHLHVSVSIPSFILINLYIINGFSRHASDSKTFCTRFGLLTRKTVRKKSFIFTKSLPIIRSIVLYIELRSIVKILIGYASNLTPYLQNSRSIKTEATRISKFLIIVSLFTTFTTFTRSIKTQD